MSSLFLESISLGNFGSLVVFWGITRSTMERQLRFWSIVAGIALIILSDSRFSASFLGVGILILLMNPRITTPVVIAMPFVAMAGLCLAAAGAPMQDVPSLEGTTFHDRLVFSGRILLDLDIFKWMGVGMASGYTLDTGYAYVLSNVGLIGLTVFWAWFISLRGEGRAFYALRNTAAAYFAVLFCISQSQFTIKTAALLWFLLGVLSVTREAARRAEPSKSASVYVPAH